MKIQEIISNDQLGKPTPSVKDIAGKFGVDIEWLKRQLQIGASVEKEHTNDIEIAKEIALDHLNELPDYYQKLRKVEK